MRFVFACLLLGCSRTEPVVVKDPSPQVASAQPVVDAAAPIVDAKTEAPRAWKSCSEPVVAAKLTTVRDVDWCNHDYLPGIASLRSGRAELHEYAELGGAHDTDIFTLGSVAYGDADGDGVEEAAVVLDHESWSASGNHHDDTRVFVFTVRAGKLVEIGNRITHLRSVARIEYGAIRLHYGTEAGCIQELHVAGGKLLYRSDPCVDLK